MSLYLAFTALSAATPVAKKIHRPSGEYLSASLNSIASAWFSQKTGFPVNEVLMYQEQMKNTSRYTVNWIIKALKFCRNIR